jgi:hypothetical protein
MQVRLSGLKAARAYKVYRGLKAIKGTRAYKVSRGYKA